jgi:hypothetical protein
MMRGQARAHLEQVLNSDDLLQGIEPDDVLAALYDDGITSLEEVARRALQDYRDRKADPVRSQPIAAAHFRSATDQQRHTGGSEYLPPDCALFIDGIAYDPKDITRFNGQDLYMVLTKSGSNQPVLSAFTNNTIELALQARQALSVLDGRSTPVAPASALSSVGDPFNFNPNNLQMFSDVGFDGDWFWLAPGFNWPDLRNVSRDTFLFSSSDWNDTISSMAGTNTTCTYYADILLGGAQLTIQPYIQVPDLRTYGWNDQISSVVNWA